MLHTLHTTAHYVDQTVISLIYNKFHSVNTVFKTAFIYHSGTTTSKTVFFYSPICKCLHTPFQNGYTQLQNNAPNTQIEIWILSK